ncbi:MAG TPA: class I SAM-dependent methyltransferase [Dehalococcoidia bacterium]
MAVKKGVSKVQSTSSLDFRLMSLTYKCRDFLQPRINILKEVGIKQGFQVLDYGCGPGSYIRSLAELVGKSGTIYALDVNPLAIQAVNSLASKEGLTNMQTILSGCQTGLLSNSVDVVLLYDIIHDLDEPHRVLAELHRILRPEGILSVTDHHMKEAEIVSRVISQGLFKLSAKGKSTYSFSKEAWYK